ncbi:hypothetical protein HYH03_004586 [Edaphochlamys debaryana]|uniref:Uncharacterized protein n=1 Tax=Edaphochlamys debaryana TaxID=47281 RepID=A0A835Y7E8_9CHLO|nr:hypothetical protein HYH03_004586 [Edaphochlamys debaryana]|eukprot:KAG2497431.1 hypothetical protein HYH03_004586 [Edaphochlamys debaryana]
MEADGALVDIHLEGHRAAFNAAFQSIGMDCVSWSGPVYNDLLGASDGTGEGLVAAYYQTVGWPVMLSTSDRPGFVRRVHAIKQEKLGALLRGDRVPLREDVKQVVADAVADGACVALLAGTQCTHAEELAASCVRQLGGGEGGLGGAVRVFTFALAPPEEQEPGEDPPTPMLSQMLSAAAGDAKQRAAMQLVCSWKSIGDGPQEGAGVGSKAAGLAVDPSLLAAGGSQQRISPEFLSALLATTGVPAARSLVVAASNPMLQAAATLGAYTVVVPRKFAGQGTFPAARTKFDGYGAGLCTWARLRQLLASAGAAGAAGNGKRLR